LRKWANVLRVVTQNTSKMFGNTSYRWEKNINATWENVQEDESGRIIAINQEKERSHHAKRQRLTQSVRRGLIRYLVVGIDCSQAAAEKDYRPSRLEACKQQLMQFIKEFYDQNPISQLAIGVTRDRIAEKISDLSSNSKSHIKLLEGISHTKGLASLQNLLSLIIHTLRYIPNYAHREAIIVYNSLSTCDPGNIFQTIEELQTLNVRVHIVCLSAEVFICKRIAELTGGKFFVALHAQHLHDIFQQLTIPCPETVSKQAQQTTTEFLHIGFPKRTFDTYPHLGYDGKEQTLLTSAYLCPRCVTRTQDIPTVCCVCNLSLNSSSHLARSFHHLFPVPNFAAYTVNYDTQEEKYFALLAEPDTDTDTDPATVDVTTADKDTDQSQLVWLEQERRFCRGCVSSLEQRDKLLWRCPACHHFFCVDCDLFIHDSLHNCPGCNS